MKKSKCNKTCINCGGNNVIFYGKQNNGKQRYKCKDCNTLFTDDLMFTCERSPKRAMTVLLNLLNNHEYDAKSLSKAFNKVKDSDKVNDVNKIRIDTQYVKNESSDYFTVNCYNPKLLICADDKAITFYPLPTYVNKNSKNKSRKIIINDSDFYNGLISNKQHTYINRS